MKMRGIEWSRRDFARLRDKAYFSEPETLFHRFSLFSKFETLKIFTAQDFTYISFPCQNLPEQVFSEFDGRLPPATVYLSKL